MQIDHASTQVLLKSCQDRLDIEFYDLCYYPRGKKAWKMSKDPILHSINGKFRSGRLTAILGPSGAGKTTLLNVLAGFKTSGVSGTVIVKGKERNIQEFRKQSCYIAQEFTMLDLLTTKETMMIAAELKLHTKLSKQKIVDMVIEIIELLGLEKATNTPVGKLSGGEKKRLSICLELLTNPPVMFFDEPTSGLDSSSAVQVISHLQSLAQGGRTVVCSIHQPSSRLFEMFDDLYIIAEGNCLYNGPIDNMTSVFKEFGYQCPTYYNRADFAIEIASDERNGNTEQLINKYREHENIPYIDQLDQLEVATMPGSPISGGHEKLKWFKREGPSYPTSTYRQFCALLKRSILHSYRDRFIFQLRVLTHVCIGLLLGAVYYDVGNDASKTTSNVGCIFFFILFLFFSNAMPTVISVPQEMTVVLREHLNNWYSLRSYYLSKLVAEFPIQVLCPCAFVFSAYILTGQPTDGTRLFKFWIICFIVTMIGHAMGLAIGALANNNEIGMFIVPASTVPMMLFSGFFLTLQDVPGWLRWITSISHFRYAFEGVMQCVYGYNRTDMICNEVYCYFKSPKFFLEQFHMADAKYEHDVLALVIWTILLQILVYVLLKWRVYISR